jgi:Ca2+-transporting ATPase
MDLKRQWQSLTIEETIEALEANPEGLHVPEAEARLEKFGFNEIKEERKVSIWELLISQVKNPLVYVLVAAAIISLAAGEAIDAIVIAVVIIINTLIGFFQEYQAEEALAALKAQAAPEAEVVRKPENSDEYMEMSVPAAYDVPGDIILLDEGTRVPADARLLEAHNLEVDEAMLTGESFSVTKTTETLEEDLPIGDRTNLIFGGTAITRGRGRAIVYATAKETEMGKIATLIQETEKAQSPLQIQIADLSKKLGIIAFFVALIMVAVGLLVTLELEEVFLYALATAVSSIPEGLPAVMSITLAIGVNRMAKRNAIIRRLPAVDTLGAASVICTDKTGTLTKNKMTVQRIVAGDKMVEVTGTGYTPEGGFLYQNNEFDPCDDPDVRLALKIGSLCNDARLIQHRDGRQYWDIKGDPTEAALVVAATKAGFHKERLEKEYHRIDELPFSSKTKYMVTFHDNGDDEVWVFMKGAPETVLSFSGRLHSDGETKPMSDEDRKAIRDHNHEMAEQALRVLGLAYQKIPRDRVEKMKEDLEYGNDIDMTFVGLAGMMDPPRQEVFEAIERCKRAGIRVIMATGDHYLTAKAIARQIGIIEEDEWVYTGAEIDDMDDDELDEVMKKASAFARVSPSHKHRLVGSLQRLGNVVAMTGDGVNDAPALQAAEIGIAMGITGTDVTKETAEMVLTDDNFASIVNAVEEGRVVFTNVRKVVKLLLATNAGEVLTLLSALILFTVEGLIITPVQILWINLVTDGILDITLAMEPKEKEVMNEPPRKQEARIINNEIALNILIVAVVMAVGTLFMYQHSVNSNLIVSQTVVFTTLAMFQVFNALNCRSRTQSIFKMNFFSNPYLLLGIAGSILLQIGAIYLPFMQQALETVPLALSDWGLIILVTISIIAVDEIRKLIQRRVEAKQA